ncbi:MAG: hypothetical protein QFX32_08680 [Methanolinea sp.]|nr:hypothetical protein [Methanolinea sp.]
MWTILEGCDMKIRKCLILIGIILTVGIAVADYIPPYCNAYDFGSSFTGSQVSMVTTTSERNVASCADSMKNVDYSVSLSGIGSASSWVNAYSLGGKTGYTFDKIRNMLGSYSPAFWNPDLGTGTPGNGFMQVNELAYSEKTTASGIIQSFSKVISIQC